MIEVNERVSIDEAEIEERFVLASGPGGQNVNKVATAVQLRFDVRRSPNLPEEVRARLLTLAGRRVNAEGVLVIDARRYRSQERNRADARARLVALIDAACRVPVRRRPTRPTVASRHRRMDAKTRRGSIKRLRGDRGDE